MKSDRILEGMHNEVVTDRLDRLHYSAAKEVRRSRDQRELARYVREEGKWRGKAKERTMART